MNSERLIREFDALARDSGPADADRRWVFESPAEAPIEPEESIRCTEWVFGYGSLIWDPGFDHTESSLARVHGWHRAFCIHSTVYRGTPTEPGIVLGLDRGGSADGLAFRLAPGSQTQAIAYLYAREMPNRVYEARLVDTRLVDGRIVRALTFVANRQSASYARLSETEVLQRLSRCRGKRGPNRDYAVNTWRALASLGVQDHRLGKMIAQLQQPELEFTPNGATALGAAESAAR